MNEFTISRCVVFDFFNIEMFYFLLMFLFNFFPDELMPLLQRSSVDFSSYTALLFYEVFVCELLFHAVFST
ncbi:hypothetical protein, partial [Saccharophagus degradans]